MKKTKKKTAGRKRRRAGNTPPRQRSRDYAPNILSVAPKPGLAIAAADPRPLSLPELWCKIEIPVSVRFLEAMRADDAASLGDGRKRPAMLARVYDMRDGEMKDLALPERLAAVFAVLPSGGYVGRAYSIHRHRRHERKNAAGYTVAEIARD